MAGRDSVLTQEEFASIYSKVPRLTVEVVMANEQGEVFLTKRAIEPCKGQWHLPGGTVQFGEPLQRAAQRIARKELGIELKSAVFKGFIEYPSHYLRGLDSPVGMVFEVAEYLGEVTPDAEAMDSGWFAVVPDDMHADQDDFLLANGYLRR